MDNSNTIELVYQSVQGAESLQPQNAGEQTQDARRSFGDSTNKIRKESYNAYMKEYMKQHRTKIKLQNPIVTKKERMEKMVTPGFLEQFRDYLKTGENIVVSSNKFQKHLVTIRYTNDTYVEVKKYCETHEKYSWIYSTKYMPKNVEEKNKLMFMIEMNNTTNQITGIGIIKIKLSDIQQQKYPIHEVVETNNYQIIATYRKDRSEMNVFEESVMKMLDVICFKNRGNHKNFKGIATFSVDCGFDLIDFFTVMMRIHMHSRKIVHTVIHEIINDIITSG